MNLLDNINKLIQIGNDLVPKGGIRGLGYNDSEQPEYVSWRLQTLAIINKIGESAKPLVEDLQNDKIGSYFYKDSAERVLGVLKVAKAIIENEYNEQKIVQEFPRIVISRDGSRAIRVEEIETQWRSVPNYDAVWTAVRAILYPNGPVSLIEIKKFYPYYEYSGFDWSASDIDIQNEIILLAIGEYLDSNIIPVTTGYSISITNDILEIKKKDSGL